MKKYLLVFLTIFLIPINVQAKTIKVMSLEQFSTANPSNTFALQTIEDEKFEYGFILPAGSVIKGSIQKVQEPRRGKRNSYFELAPKIVTFNDESFDVDLTPYTLRVVGYRPATEVAYTFTKRSIGYIFRGTTQGIAFVEGAVKAPEGERLKSGLQQVYVDSPLSYIEVGKQLEVEIGDILVLKLIKTR